MLNKDLIPAMKKFSVTVDLPDRYWTAQLYIEAESPEEAESAVEVLLTSLQEYVSDADLQINDIEPID